MKPATECIATASLLRSGSTLVLTAHVGAALAGFHIHSQSHGIWFCFASLLCWCAVVYLAVRIKIDAGFFVLLAADPDHAPEELDHFLDKAGLRKVTKSRTIDERCQGAIGLWRKMVAVLVLQLFLLFLAEIKLLQ